MIKNNDKDNCENGLLKIYKDDLISFVDDMSNQLSKCYVQKDSVIMHLNFRFYTLSTKLIKITKPLQIGYIKCTIISIDLSLKKRE